MNIIKIINFVEPSGFAFEDLIGYYLKEEYGDVFTHTRYTNDGGKDFESNSPIFADKTTWVECKKYTTKLSYNDISNTLLMAYIKQINKILVFSYSKVNSQFYRKVAEYKERTNIGVEVYDDLILEQLLLKYKNKAWFQHYISLDNTLNQYEQSLDLQCNYKLSKENRGPDGNIRINLNEILFLEILIINNSLNERYVQIDTSAFLQCDYFQLLNIEFANNVIYKMEIPKRTSQIIRLNVKVIKFCNEYTIPSIKVNGKKLSIYKHLHTNWLAETKLIGEKYRKEYKNVDNFISNQMNLCFVSITGSSATGKSKFLIELKELALRSQTKYFYCDVDTEKSTAKDFCLKIFSYLAQLPLLCKNKSTTIKMLQSSTENNYKNLAIRILYKRDYSISENIDEIARCILMYLQEERYIIIIDNVQKYNSDAIKIFRRLIELSSTVKGQSSIFFAFNTDYLYKNTTADDFRLQLVSLSEKKPEKYYYIYFEGFDEFAATTYISECLELKNNSSENRKLIKKIVNMVGTNPLSLRNYLIYLHRNGFITFRENKLYILEIDEIFNPNTHNLVSFNSLIDCIDKDIFNKLEKRQQKTYLNIVCCLNLFKLAPEQLIAHLDKRYNLIYKYFIPYGLVLYHNECKSYSYKHIEIKRAYKKKYPLSCLDTKTIYNKMNASFIKNKYVQEFFILAYENGSLNPTDIKKMSYCIFHEKIDYENIINIYSIVLSLFEENIIEYKSDDIILFNVMTNIYLKTYGISYSISFFERVVNILCKSISIFQDRIEDVLYILKDYLRNIMNTGDVQKAAIENKRIQKYSIGINKNEAKDIFLLELMKLEILTCYKEGNISGAEQVVKNIEKKFRLDTLSKAEIKMFIGNIYSHTDERILKKDIILENWQAAYQILDMSLDNYSQLDFRTKAIKLNILIKHCICGLINSQSYLERDWTNVLCLLNNTQMIYFEIKLRQLLIIQYLNGNHLHLNKIDVFSYATETIDMLCNEYGNKFLYAISYFLLAQLYLTEKEYDLMYEYFISFYSIILQFYFQNQTANNDNYLLFEMIIELRRNKLNYRQTFNVALLNQIPNLNLYNQILDIWNKNEEEFEHYFLFHSKLSLLNNSDYGINIPII